MSSSTRAFFIAALIALPCGALLHLLALIGVSGAWPAMVHMALFGWITAMIYAVNFHTMPVFTARDFPYPRLIWTQWLAWCAGVVLVTAGILMPWRGAEIAGLLLQLLAALTFVANTISLFRHGPHRAHRPPMPPIPDQSRVDRLGTRATKLAGVCLPLALLLLLAVRLTWLDGAWLLAAEHIMALGWVMLMIVGVAYHVLPRFSGVGTHGPGWAQAQLLCQVGALVLMATGLGFGWPRAFALGGILMTLALALFAWGIWPTVSGRSALHAWRTPGRASRAAHRHPPIPIEERTR